MGIAILTKTILQGRTQDREARPLASGQTHDRPGLEPQPQILSTGLPFTTRGQWQAYPPLVLGFPLSAFS